MHRLKPASITNDFIVYSMNNDTLKARETVCTCWMVAGEQVVPDVQNEISPLSHPVAEAHRVHLKARSVAAGKEFASLQATRRFFAAGCRCCQAHQRPAAR